MLEREILLVRYLASSGLGSRRHCDRLIADKKVTVNGETAALGQRINPGKDRVLVDDIPVESAPENIYILLNKPRGCLVSDRDPEGRPLAKDLLPEFGMRLFPVGRLDFQTEGALLMTNDGIWANKISHPRNQILKKYLAKVRNLPTMATLKRWETGFTDQGQFLKAFSAKIYSRTKKNAWIEVLLTGGVNRQVRRMGTKTGHPVVKLIRTSVGPVELGNLAPGKFRYLTPTEIRGLMKPMTVKSPRQAKRSKRSRELRQS